MNPESCVLRLLYFADRYKIDRKSRLQALAYRTKEQEVLECPFEKEKDATHIELYSENVVDAVGELESMGLLSVQETPTYGGDTVYSYHLTEKGIDRAERLIQESDDDKTIKNVCEEYGDVPISNLLNNIVQSEPAHMWSE